MQKDMSALTEGLIGKNGKSVIDKNSGRIEALASSPEGQRVKQMLDSSGDLEKAINSSDTAAMKNILGNVLKTKEGQHLVAELKNIMDGK